MHYRWMCGEKVSALGFGLMRLPTADGQIGRGEAAKQIHHTVDQGVNSLDSATPYHGGGSELFLGELLSAGLRDQVLVVSEPLLHFRRRSRVGQAWEHAAHPSHAPFTLACGTSAVPGGTGTMQ